MMIHTIRAIWYDYPFCSNGIIRLPSGDYWLGLGFTVGSACLWCTFTVCFTPCFCHDHTYSCRWTSGSKFKEAMKNGEVVLTWLDAVTWIVDVAFCHLYKSILFLFFLLLYIDWAFCKEKILRVNSNDYWIELYCNSIRSVVEQGISSMKIVQVFIVLEPSNFDGEVSWFVLKYSFLIWHAQNSLI